ncbi:MAG: phospho-sugar mutase, partial [Clostridiales bacterium]|nr:phospho-sugar mutase [Clostridiales bacterium]
MNEMKEYERWLAADAVEDGAKEELRAIAGDGKEIKERFYKHLEFGTGGLRGILGAGTNRMNKYVVRRATQGIADYISKHAGEDAKKRGVVIAFDCRHFSDLFALETALVFAANGIKAYLFDALRPTPELSFAVRHLHAVAGVNITASHNPSKYNGYKVYWEDGGQIPPHISDAVLSVINDIPMFAPKTVSQAEAASAGLLEIIGKEVDDAFIEAVAQTSVNGDAVRRVSDTFKLIYTPLHGAGNKPVRAILKKAGFAHVFIVKEQEQPDGAFPTVASPNPENRECFDLAVQLARREGVSLIIGTDPDADRVGIAVRDSGGEYVTLSGNQVGAMLTHYILTAKKERGTLAANSAVVSTIVSTKMTRAICGAFGVTLFETLTGFKFIGEKIHEFETNHSYEYVFGFEESYGYLAGTHARDKDAVSASMLIAEMAAYYAARGESLYDVMNGLYARYGGFSEETVSVTMEGVDGLAKIRETMQRLRNGTPRNIGGFDVLAVRDYKAGTRRDLVSGTETALELPVSDVLYFELSDGAGFVARPSGTEPKIKLYYLTQGETKTRADAVLAKVKAAA